MKTIECYKVVIQGKSILARGHKTCDLTCACRLAVQYEIGKVTFPKVGKLYCFTSLAQAREFAKDYLLYIHDGLRIFKGIGGNPKYMKYTAQYYFHIETFWKAVLRKESVRDTTLVYSLPKGSVCVDFFEPTEIMENDNDKDNV